MNPRLQILGVDCATQARNVGLARAELTAGGLRFLDGALGSDRDESVAEQLAGWMADGVSLLALDAPLGWPKALAEELIAHQAGQGLAVSPHQLFRRHTDEFIREAIGKQSLDVGADRIARTAHAALAFIAELGAGLGRHIPLAWDPSISGISAVEVYPAATLRAHGISAAGYKAAGGEAARRRVSEQLKAWLDLPLEIPAMAGRSDALDAVICLLAARDFLMNVAMAPLDMALAQKEGWIWVKAPEHRT